MKYCVRCGQPVPAESLFCTHCGAQTSPYTPPTTPPVAAYTPVPAGVTSVPGSAPQPPPPAPIAGPATSHTLRNIILAVVGVLIIVVALGIGGTVYVGIKVKQKATSIAAKVTSPISAHSHDPAHASATNDSSDSAEQMLNGLASLLQGNQQDNKGATSSPKVPVVPCAPAAMPSQDGARIPLRKGTVVTTAWGIKKGDVEVQNAVTGVDATGFTDISSNGPYVDDNGANVVGQSETNTVCNEDLLKASNFTATTGLRIPQIVHGLTRLRLSDKIFQEIRATGHTHLTDEEFVPGDQGRGRDVTKFYGGDLVWTERQDVAYPLIVNDQRVTVPAIHLTGTFDPDAVPTEFYVLDDPLDPLVLLYKMTAPQYHGGRFRIELIRVNFEVINPINLVEKQLTEQKRAVTYGIYFDFNKDTIKPESERVLKLIVQAMTDNPTWKLTVEGHTDNIGGNDYNLDLSKRRAAAVKRALVDRYHIDPDRLQTNGFGASRPVDTNDTLEGRARNRRVELTRE